MGALAELALIKGCTACGGQFPATSEFFGSHPLGRFGLYPQCRPCKKRADAERRNRPEQLARQRAWRANNRDRVRDYNEAYRAAGYTSTTDTARWRANNIDHARAYARGQQKRRIATPEGRLLGRIRARLRTMIHGRAGRRTEELLGYTMAALKVHIERQFTSGMTWEDVLSGRIHIDHIVPVSTFQISTPDDPDFKLCWALANLRPMWARDNQSKGGRRLTLL